MLLTALIAGVVLLAPIAYVLFRRFSFTLEEIEFGSPQNEVAAIFLEIREDSVRRIRLVYQDGTFSDVQQLHV